MNQTLLPARKAAQHFSTLAALLEVSGASEQKIKSFLNAARSLERFEGTLADALEAVEEKSLRGFGKTLAPVLQEYALTGSTELYSALVTELGASFVELLDLPGIGAKKAKFLWEETPIRSIAHLREACEDGSLQAYKGFAQKTVQTLLSAIRFREKHQGLMRLDTALGQAEEILATLSEQHPDGQFMLVGPLRRYDELIPSIDIIGTLIPEIARPTLSVLLSDIHTIDSTETNITLTLRQGTKVVYTAVTNGEHAFYRAAFSLSLSDAHRKLLEERASLQNTQLSAILQSSAGDSEETFRGSFYQQLQLCDIPPELQELGQDAIDQAQQLATTGGSFPPLVEIEHIRGIVHAHSTYSDGAVPLAELALHVRDAGFHYLGISDHSQSATYARGLSIDQVKYQHDEIDRLNETLAPFRVLKGIESDILSDGSLDYPDTILDTFDFVIASIHSNLKQDSDTLFKRLSAAIANPYTTCLGHLTTRKLLEREEAAVVVPDVLALAATHGVAVEINGDPRRLDLPYRFHQMAKKLGVVLPVCPDAHSLAGLANIRYGVLMARKGGLSAADIPTAWEPERAIAFWTRGKRDK